MGSCCGNAGSALCTSVIFTQFETQVSHPGMHDLFRSNDRAQRETWPEAWAIACQPRYRNLAKFTKSSHTDASDSAGNGKLTGARSTLGKTQTAHWPNRMVLSPWLAWLVCYPLSSLVFVGCKLSDVCLCNLYRSKQCIPQDVQISH